MAHSPHRAVWHDDTLRGLATWAVDRYQLGKINLVFRNGIKRANGRASSGCANVYEDGRVLIELNSKRSVNALADVLAHEFAHVIAIREHHYKGHGPRFHKILIELVTAWNKLNG